MIQGGRRSEGDSPLVAEFFHDHDRLVLGERVDSLSSAKVPRIWLRAVNSS